MLPVSERVLVFLVGAVQFVNILDFVIVSPLAPDFARDLHIPPEHLGYIAGSYTAAAAVAGLVGSLFLERFDRKRALVFCMLGLACGTLACAAADGLTTLVGARALAGTFGGPATALAFAIIADAVPTERRGKAVGAVMGAFSIASVLGVPAGLELARFGGWPAALIAVGVLALAITAATALFMPPMRQHLGRPASERASFAALLGRPVVRGAYGLTALTMMAGFAVLPNIPAFLQNNLGFPRERFGLMYLGGGIVSLITMRTAGHLVDRFGATPVGTAGAGILACVIAVYFGAGGLGLPAALLLPLFMLALGLRNVASTTLNSKVPLAHERARFMSLQSSVAHVASSSGAFLAAGVLTTDGDGHLLGLGRVAGLSMTLTLIAPLLLRWVEQQVSRRDARPLGVEPLLEPPPPRASS